jgi:hypothetical protein
MDVITEIFTSEETSNTIKNVIKYLNMYKLYDFLIVYHHFYKYIFKLDICKLNLTYKQNYTNIFTSLRKFNRIKL